MAIDKTALGGKELTSDPPYVDRSNDLTLGSTFYMPAVRPLSFMNDSDIPVSSSIDLLRTQRPLIGQEAVDTLINGFERAEYKKSGLISTLDLAQGLVRTGLGALAGGATANLLGTIFSLPSSTKMKMANYGAIGGAILNSGLLPHIMDAAEKGVYTLMRPMDKSSQESVSLNTSLANPIIRAKILTRVKKIARPNMSLENRTKSDIVISEPTI